MRKPSDVNYAMRRLRTVLRRWAMAHRRADQEGGGAADRHRSGYYVNLWDFMDKITVIIPDRRQSTEVVVTIMGCSP